MIAKVVLPLSLNIAFDYLVPPELENIIVKWARVRVPFRNSQMIGYVADFSKSSAIKNLKNIAVLLDDVPILDASSLKIAEYLSKNYFCSLGEAISLMLPDCARRGRKIEIVSSIKYQVISNKTKGEVLLVHDLVNKRWQVFCEKIEAALKDGLGIIILMPEINSCLAAKQLIEEKFKVKAALLQSKNTGRKELEEWLRVKNGGLNIVVGTSTAIFAPVRNLGLIIINEEDNPVYKQEQSPFYNAKDIALFRAQDSGALLVLVSSAPSLEAYYAAKKERYGFIRLAAEKKANVFVQIIDLSQEQHKQKKRNILLSNILENEINSALVNKKKVLLFLNRVGFSAYAKCAKCAFIITCPRCSKNLVFVYEGKKLLCRTCNFKQPAPDICPKCGLSYIKYLGIGTEKLESELHRLFPSAAILRCDRLQENMDLAVRSFDILIATQIILKDLAILKDIGLLGIISLDSSLNRVDFRAAEKTFQMASRLISAAGEKAIIQTANPEHYLIKALIKNDYDLFYKEELKERKELLFPPFSSLVLITLRGRSCQKVESAAENLSAFLKEKNTNKKIEIFNSAAAMPLKVRDNFRYNILLKSRSVKNLIKFINKHLTRFKKSGIIITVDIGPL